MHSFVRFPEVRLHIYSYDENTDPRLEGCEWMNADEILPYDIAEECRKKFEKRGLQSVSNIFRYKLLHEKGGWYFDTDCLLIKPLDPLLHLEYVFAWQDKKLVANGVMRFPANHGILSEMYEECIRLDPKKYPWNPGEGPLTGPTMLTKYLREYELIDKALPPEYFYPIHWSEVEAFRHPITVGETTFIVHLWEGKIRKRNFTASDLDKSLLDLVSQIDTGPAFKIGSDSYR